MKKAVLKTFALIIGKHLSWSLLLIVLWVVRPATLLKRNSNKGIQLLLMQNF